LENNLSNISKELTTILSNEPEWVIKRTLQNIKKFLSNNLISKYNSAEIKPLNKDEVSYISNIDNIKKQEYFLLGEELLRKSQFAYFIMAGGVATSMGGCAKAIVTAKENKSFIQIKLDHIRYIQKKYNCKVPVILMTSKETDNEIDNFINSNNLLKDIELIKIVQPVTVRFTKEKDELKIAKINNKISFVPGGHYDSFILLNEIKEDLKSKNIKTIFINNIDNLGATIDPIIIGCHLSQKSLFTPEIARKEKNDKGGTFAKINDELRLLEGPMVPEDYQETFSDTLVHKYFNTNLIYLETDIFEYFDEINNKVPVFINKKNFDGIDVFGFEGAVGLVFGLKKSSLIAVDRQTRFLPIKYLSDLWLLRSNFMVLDKETSCVHQIKLIRPQIKLPESFIKNIDDFNKKIADGGETTDFSELESLDWQAKDGKVESNVKFIGKVTIKEENSIINENNTI